VLARAGSMSWSSFRGKERESKTYHEPELQKKTPMIERMRGSLRGLGLERPMTYEMEARITKLCCL